MEEITAFLILVGCLAFMYILICGALWIIKTHGFVTFVFVFVCWVVGDAIYGETMAVETSSNTVILCSDIDLGE